MDLSIGELSYAVCVLLLASIVRGLTGFGFSAIIVTGLGLVVAPAQTVMLALFLEIIASVRMLPSTWKNINYKIACDIMHSTAVGTPVGVKLLVFLSARCYSPDNLLCCIYLCRFNMAWI